MNGTGIMTRSALNGLFAGVIALAIAVVMFSLTGTPLGTALLYGIVIGVLTLAVVWVVNFAVLRSRHRRERDVHGRQT